VTSAQLTPPDVEVADVVEAAQAVGARGEQGRIDWVVREVQARLAAWLHRCGCAGGGGGAAHWATAACI
jgi:hypothetical protein